MSGRARALLCASEEEGSRLFRVLRCPLLCADWDEGLYRLLCESHERPSPRETEEASRRARVRSIWCAGQIEGEDVSMTFAFPTSGKEVKVYSFACEHPSSSTGGDHDIYSPAASAAKDGGGEHFSPADDESELIALTATSCSYASACPRVN